MRAGSSWGIAGCCAVGIMGSAGIPIGTPRFGFATIGIPGILAGAGIGEGIGTDAPICPGTGGITAERRMTPPPPPYGVPGVDPGIGGTRGPILIPGL